MAPKPVVIIPPSSPNLEAIALAVLWGAADVGGTIPPPLIVGDATANLPSTADAPFVFLGWRADLDESRKRATETLAALNLTSVPPRRVVTFEVMLRGSPIDEMGAPPDKAQEGPSSGPVMTPPERFLIDPGTGGNVAGLLELVRARKWAARVYSEGTSPSLRGRPGDRRDDSTPPSSRIAPWCDAAD